jgi:hypothetical protein
VTCWQVQVDTSRLEAICRAKVKLNPDSVLDPEAPQGLAHVVRQLQQLQVSYSICSQGSGLLFQGFRVSK